MAEEFYALVHNDIWHLVSYHDNMNLLGCKCQIKYNLDGLLGAKRHDVGYRRL